MNQSPKIRFNRVQLLLDDPIAIQKGFFIFHPTMKDIAMLGYDVFGSFISVWNLVRKELITEETDETWNLTDFEVWREYITHSPVLKELFKQSVMFFIHQTVEFLPMQRSIFIGELASGIELTEELFSEIQTVINMITCQSKEDVRKKTAPRSKKAEEIAAKIKAGEEKIKAIKKSQGIDPLANQIISLVAHSHNTYSEIFNMTLIQFEATLDKTVAIENYNIGSMLSPYVDKKHKGKNKHWLQ